MKFLFLALFILPFLAGAQDMKVYQNYDFVPGDKILFEDDFRSDQDGEFPAHWNLEGGPVQLSMKELRTTAITSNVIEF